MRARKFGHAIAMYTAAIDACPDSPNVHVYYSNRAAAQLRMKSYAEAESDARAALDANPAYDKARTRLGTALRHLGRYEEAIENFETVLEHSPGNEVAREQLDAARTELASQVRTVLSLVPVVVGVFHTVARGCLCPELHTRCRGTSRWHAQSWWHGPGIDHVQPHDAEHDEQPGGDADVRGDVCGWCGWCGWCGCVVVSDGACAGHKT